MIGCYALSLLPLIVGFFLWWKRGEIALWEWLLAVVMCLMVTGLIHMCAIKSMTDDTETWSGQLTKATFHPEWIEEYQVAIYKNVSRTRRVSDGRGGYKTEHYTSREFSHYETRHRRHEECWSADDNLSGQFSISKQQFDAIAINFGGVETVDGHKSGFDSGDPNLYVAQNKTGYIYSTTATRRWENRVKAAPSTFSFATVPTNIVVFDYPQNANGWNNSDRLKGSAQKAVPILEWDKMNSRLGPTRKVNVIACGFPAGSDTALGNWQEAKWIGGKKNDLVICYAGDPQKPEWVKVFGWTERFDCKRNLESLVLKNGLSIESLPVIESEIKNNYTIKDWTEFDYLSVEPPWWAYLVIIIAMVVTQGLWWWFAWSNDINKGGGRLY